LLFVGCGTTGEGATIDGWKITGVTTCPIPNLPRDVPYPETWDCALGLSQWLAAAVEGFNRRDPTHPPIIRTTLHGYGGTAVYSGGGPKIAVFELADGSVRAIGVMHPGIDTEHLITVDPPGP
jgi:hypothetical protein